MAYCEKCEADHLRACQDTCHCPCHSMSEPTLAQPDARDQEISRVRRQAIDWENRVRNIVRDWDEFHTHLADGEYKGLGALRLGITCCRRALAKEGESDAD